MATERAEAVIDEEVLGDLRDALGEGFDDFVRRFIASAEAGVDAMDRAFAGDDLERVAARAHDLKGTAGYLGATDLARRLGLLQQAAEAGDREQVRVQVSAVRAAWGQAIARLAPQAR